MYRLDSGSRTRQRARRGRREALLLPAAGEQREATEQSHGQEQETHINSLSTCSRTLDASMTEDGAAAHSAASAIGGWTSDKLSTYVAAGRRVLALLIDPSVGVPEQPQPRPLEALPVNPANNDVCIYLRIEGKYGKNNLFTCWNAHCSLNT